jgi:transcriptional regulator with XRE-family HTH domain
MKTPHSLEINGEAIRLKREARGWTPADLASRACLSVKQIKQLEEGGISSFYSESVKATSARRVAELLGVDWTEVFIMPEVAGEEVAVANLTPAPAHQNLSEVSELLQSPNTMNVVEEDEDPHRSRNWLIAMAVILAIAAVVLFKPSSQDVSSAQAPVSTSLPAELAASQASEAASGVLMSASEASLPVAAAASAASAASQAAAPSVVASASMGASVAAAKPVAAASAHALVASAVAVPAKPASAPVVKPAALSASMPVVKPAAVNTSSTAASASH